MTRKIFALVLCSMLMYSCAIFKSTEKFDAVVLGEVTWATHNIGARSPEDAGNHYTWSEAQNACPQGWRLPTFDEFQSLINKKNTWTTKNGVNGRVFGSGDSTIFLPATGWRSFRDGTLNYIGMHGSYWSSTQYDSERAMRFGFDNDNVVVNWVWRTNGSSVRCVKIKNSIIKTNNN